MGSDPQYNYPAQPSYGEGMADAMKAQMEQLLGQGDYADIYKEAGFEGGNLGDILTGVEAPIRKQTAQIDTDVLRQTILGGSQKVVKDPETGKYGIPGAEIVTNEQVDGDAPTQTAGGRYQIIQTAQGGNLDDARMNNRTLMPQYAIIDTDTGGLLNVEQDELMTVDGIFDPKVTNEGANLKAITERFSELNGKIAEGVAKGIPEEEVKLEFEFTNPNTGKPLQEGDVVREGTGMVDLLGDARGVQESRKLSRDEQGQQLIEQNPELDQVYEVAQNDPTNPYYGLSKSEAGRKLLDDNNGDLSKISEAFNVSGLSLPEFAKFDAGRQAGFDESGKFLGLSALAEDIGRGGQQRAREADIADVERLGGRATDAYRAQGDLGGALAQARGIGAGGEKGLSAIPKDPLFEGAALDSLAARTAAENKGIDAITSEGMAATMARSPNALRAATDYRPTADIAGGEIGADTLRTALMSDAETSLAGGLTPREERQISEAMKAQSTMMGRTFDQSAGLAEAKARLLEDRNRQALNRQYAQQVLGQEAGLQQSDLGRGLQASLANQQAANRAAEFGVGAGMQKELAGAQLDQQTALANQAMQQEAAKYTAQEAMQAQLANEANRQQAASFDVNALQQQQRLNEQLKQAGTLGYVDAATRLAALEDTSTLDPFQAVLGRTGGGSLQAGQGVFGQAGYGLQSGPQYLNPESGLGFISNQATNAANMFNAQQAAGATRQAGMMGGLGTLGAGIAGMFDFCWVAREVYGAHNPAWLDFRQWMFSSAPRWFFKLYLTFGERFANFISNKPRLKARIRLWMDSKIGR